MKNVLLQAAMKLNRSRKRRKSWQKVVQTLIMVVVFCTTYALILPAITMQAEPVCGMEDHTHTEECYISQTSAELICSAGPEEIWIHQHGDHCWDASGTLICLLPEIREHSHTEDCYIQTQTLNCPITHVHSEACQTEQQVLSCGMEEIPAHIHDETCTGTVTVQTCTLEDHEHGEGCFEEQTLVCEIPEGEGHAHSESCYTMQMVFCDQPTAEDHVHEEGCYQTVRSLTCGLEEIQAHTHGDTCRDAEGNLICTLPEILVHTHTEECLQTREEAVLTCTIPEHTHEDACYPLEEETPETGLEFRCGFAKHTHGDACYAADGTLTCSIPEHTHEAACAVEDLDLTADMEYEGIWEAAYSRFAEADSRPQALLQMAKVQLNYRESEKNVILENDRLRGYTRYGAKFGMPYAEWNTLFAAFCVSYSGTDEAFPVQTNGEEWYLALEEAQLLQSGIPQPGDLLFFGKDSRDETDGKLKVTAVGILEERYEEDGLLEREFLLKTIQGDIGDAVSYVEAKESSLLGYAVLPEPAEEEACPLAEHIHGEGCYDAETGALVCTETEHTHEDTCFEPEQTEEVPGEAGNGLYLICTLPEHIHTDSCRNPETGDLICGLGEHSHKEACYGVSGNIPMMETPLICTLEEHIHEEVCSDAETGTLICSQTEHTHSRTCYAPAEITFSYEDDRVAMEVSVVNANGLPKGLTMEVLLLDPEEQAYAAYEEYALENASGELVGLSGYRVSFLYGGREIQLPDALVTAELTVKSVEYRETEMAAFSSVSEESTGLFSRLIAPLLAASEEEEPAAEQQREPDAVVVTLLQNSGEEVTAGGSASFTADGTDGAKMTLELGNSRTFALAREAVLNPEFQVQFYAEIPLYQYSGSAPSGKVSLPIIDTRGNGDGTGGSLPKNVGNQNQTGTDRGIVYLHLAEAGKTTTENPYGSNKLYTVYTQTDLREIYTADEVTYTPGMKLINIDKLQDNRNYDLSRVRVSQNGGSSWTDYEPEVFETLEFTNSDISAEGYLFISDDTMIRLEYESTDGTYNNSANLFDYDITTTQIYRNKDGSGSTYNTVTAAKGNSSTRTIYQQTVKNNAGVGINSAWITSGSRNFAFGNSNTGVPYASQTISLDGYANKFNQFNSYGYKGCTFGLVSGYNFAQDRLEYASGLAHQALFNDEAYYRANTVTGKTSYYRNVLNFNRTGDTYVLSGINADGAINGIRDTNLNYFFSPQQYSHIYTNNFWPMDGTVSDSTSGHDMLFGDKNDSTRKRLGTDSDFPESDDGTNHNSYFGMQFAVEFQLDGQYCGPLEYLFFGDDDMWVFLTDLETGVSRKICDIGGVHSSVGSITDLWDYIPKNTAGTYVMTVFYTERGASGSSCYIEFTLPQITSITQNTPTTGSVTIGKESVKEVDPDAQYSFRFELSAAGSSAGLNDNYSYTITDGNSSRTGTVHSGNTFTMKAKERFTVTGIPEGLRYTFTEVFAADNGNSYNIRWSDGTTGATLTDVVERNKTHTFTCTNHAAGSLVIAKKLMGSSEDEFFTMNVTLKDENGEPVSGTFGEHSFTDGRLQVKLKANEAVLLSNLPVNSVWTVEEQKAEGYQAIYSIDGTETDSIPTGTVTHKTTVTVEVLNVQEYILPNTGGVGASHFAFGGAAILAVCLMYICITGRKRQKGGR